MKNYFKIQIMYECESQLRKKLQRNQMKTGEKFLKKKKKKEKK